MSEPRDPATPDPATAPAPADRGEFEAWLRWLQQASHAGGDLAQLLSLELRLALADGRRMLLLGLAILPLGLLAWLGVSALGTWFGYLLSGSISVAMLVFLGLQLLALALLHHAYRSCRRSLTLPATRRHVQAFMAGAMQGGAQHEGMQNGGAKHAEAQAAAKH